LVEARNDRRSTDAGRRGSISRQNKTLNQRRGSIKAGKNDSRERGAR